MDKFWMVVNLNRHYGLPKVQHTTYSSALGEAKRLALQHLSDEFAVLESIVTVKTEVPVVVTECLDIPF